MLNSCRVKLRGQVRPGGLDEHPQCPHDKFGGVRPRRGNGGGQMGRLLTCKGWKTEPNAYIYFTVQRQAQEPICDTIGKPELKPAQNTTTAKAPQPNIAGNFATIEV